MKHRMMTLAVLLLVCLGAVAFATWAQENAAIEQNKEDKVQQTAGNSNNYEYLLKEYEGRLAVFKKNSTEPDMVFDLLIKMLPQYDQEQLKQGIYVKDYRELVDLIEDYIS